MKRRDLLLSLGPLFLATKSFASSSQHQHHLNKADHNPYALLLLALDNCQLQGKECRQHCLMMMQKGDTSMVKCYQSVEDMLALTGALSSIARQGTMAKSTFKKLVATCKEACAACVKECETHANKMVECKNCMEACQDCIKTCEKLMA